MKIPYRGVMNCGVVWCEVLMWVKRRRIHVISGVGCGDNQVLWMCNVFLGISRGTIFKNSRLDNSIHVEAQLRNSHYSNKFYCHKLHLVYKGNI